MQTKTNVVYVGTFPAYDYSGWNHIPPHKTTGYDLYVEQTHSITSDLGRRNENYCLHIISPVHIPVSTGEFLRTSKVSGKGPELPDSVYFGGSYGNYVKGWSTIGGGAIPSPDTLILDSPMPPFAEWASDRYRFHKSATNADMDLPTSIWELRDIKSLMKSAAAIGRTIERIRRAPQRTREMFSRRTLSSLLNTHLGYVFGLRPLMSDIRALHKGLTGGWRDGYNRLSSLINKPHRVHSRIDRQWVQDFVWGTGWSPCFGYAGLCSGTYCFSASKLITAPYGVTYGYNQYLRTKLGFDNPLLTLWNITPFSFVLDWFLDVGKALKQAASMFDMLQVQLTKVSCSRKYVPTFHTYYRPPAGMYIKDGATAWDGNLFMPEVQVGIVYSRSYERFPRVPEASPIQTSSAWRMNLASGASLALSQILSATSELRLPRKVSWSTVSRDAVQIPRGWDAWRGV